MAKVLITSALPYINGIKHLGNLIGSMLSADVYARFMRATGNEVLFICATDEHGTPAEIAAHEAGLPVADYCREQHEIQAQIYRDFALSFDYFGRSSSPQNHELTNHFYHRLDNAGFIEERTLPQVYSIDDGRFLPDRYIIGTCPHCGYPNARGDQCENCTRLLEPTDLIDARSAISGSRNLEVRQTKHLFFKLPQLADRVEEWIDFAPGLAAPRQLDRQGLAQGGAAGSRHHPRPQMGHSGRPARIRRQGVLCLVRCADRIYRRHQGMGRRRARGRKT